MKTFKQEIEEAQIFNWAIAIQEKVQILIDKHRYDDDLFIRITNGDFIEQAQNIFAYEKSLGFYDEQNIRG